MASCGKRGSGGRRVRAKRSERKRVLVVSEGKRTEPQYLEGLVKELRSSATRATCVGTRAVE